MPDLAKPSPAGEIDTLWLICVIAHYARERRQLEAALQEREALLGKQADRVPETEEKLHSRAHELERKLVASGRLVSVGELTASLAHELNNPLGIILGFAQEGLSDLDPSHPSYRTLQIINEEATRCEMVVRDLMEFARPRGPEFVQTDIKEVIARTLDLLSNRMKQENVEATGEIDSNLPNIDGDPQQLQQLLVNLCSNSLDAMPGGGKLFITAKLDTSEALAIRVADNGFGVDHENLSRIFQPFFTAKKRRGLGLGLVICDRIVRAHAGSIDVQSQAGHGTVFTIRLPVKRAEQPQSSESL
jgi:two-component system NtrC family sensor kinase